MSKLSGIFQQWMAGERGSGSTALKPLARMIAGMLVAVLLVSSKWLGSPTWLVIVLLFPLISLVLVFLSAYGFLLLKHPDSLQDDGFRLKEKALENRMVGDSISGVIEYRGGPDRNAETDDEA